MKSEPAPAFQFYPRDWLSSASVRVMSSSARGAYITLLCVCWIEGSLPSDDATLCKLSDATFQEWEEAKFVVRQRFFEKDGRLLHRRLDVERAKQRVYRKLQSDKGKKSVEARFNRGSTAVQPEGQPKVNSSSSSSSSSSIEDCTYGFADFWAAYPRHEGRAKAGKAWATLKPTPALRQTILLAVQAQRATAQWTRDGGAFIPHATTWIHGRRWEDELTPQLHGPSRVSATPTPIYDDDWCDHDPRCNSWEWHNVKVAQGAG